MNLRAATIISLLLMLGVGLFSLWVYPTLPEMVPIHWNLRGEVDGWMPKGTAILFTQGIMGTLLLLLIGGQWLSPRHFTTASFRYTYNYLMVLVIALMGYLGVAMLEAALHPQMDSGRVVIGGVMLFFTLLSNSMGKVRRNFWMGIRTPWTLASERVWIATHRMAARLWFITGLGATLALLIGVPTLPVFIFFMIAIFVPVFYSFVLYKRFPPSSFGPYVLLVCLSGLLLPGLRAEAETINKKVTMETSPTTADTSRELRFKGEADFELVGTLLLPERKEGTRSPAVLLLPGSGPPDRDGNVKPFFITDVLKQIAERLAKEGIASFRFDKRSAATYATQWPKGAEKLNETFAWKAFLGDALAAYGLLREQPEVNSKQVGILGHSEGGLITLNLAHDLNGKADAPAAITLVSTGGRMLDIIVKEQMHTLLPKQIPDKDTLKTYLDYVDKAIAQVKEKQTLPPDQPPGLNSLFNPTVLSLLHSYFTLDPAALAVKYSGPVLIVQGEKDTQVSAERDAPVLKEAFKKRAKDVSELLLLPNTSHNLKELKTPDEPGFTGPVVPAALEKIATWFRAHLDAEK